MPQAAPLLPGATIGILGGGQLGRMTAIEARRMGYRTIILDPGADSPAAQVADLSIAASLDDMDAVRNLARHADVVTLEWENAEVAALRQLEGIVPLRPGPYVLEAAQHRLREKEAARRLGLPTAEFRPVRTRAELDEALRAIGTPAVLKTVRGGYDGKGQAVLRAPGDAATAFAALGGERGVELILEAWVDFRCEISVICARNTRGELACFAPAENVHRDGILDTSMAPARLPQRLLHEARRIGEAMAEGLEVVGLLAVELFVGTDDRLRVNEIAPRPHNSGHHTIEACAVSQFEQHVRAVCGLPLGDPTLLTPAVMINLLGQHFPPPERRANWLAAFAEPGAALHLYGKQEARPGRKMGHLTVRADTPEEALDTAHRIRRSLHDPR